MGKPGKRRKAGEIEGQFVPVLYRMIDSPAFKKLSNPSRTAYLLLRRQVKQRGQKEVIFPYKSAAEYMDRHTFAKATRQLVEFGFIEISGNGGLERNPNIYRFVEGWREVR